MNEIAALSNVENVDAETVAAAPAPARSKAVDTRVETPPLPSSPLWGSPKALARLQTLAKSEEPPLPAVLAATQLPDAVTETTESGLRTHSMLALEAMANAVRSTSWDRDAVDRLMVGYANHAVALLTGPPPPHATNGTSYASTSSSTAAPVPTPRYAAATSASMSSLETKAAEATEQRKLGPWAAEQVPMVLQDVAVLKAALRASTYGDVTAKPTWMSNTPTITATGLWCATASSSDAPEPAWMNPQQKPAWVSPNRKNRREHGAAYSASSGEFGVFSCCHMTEYSTNFIIILIDYYDW